MLMQQEETAEITFQPSAPSGQTDLICCFSFWLLAGKKTKAEHMVEGRIKGTLPGSTFEVTEKGYMTDSAFEKYVDQLIEHGKAA